MADKVDTVELQFRNRRLLIDGLQIVPQWIWGGTFWFLFTKLVLDRLSPNKPGTEINLEIVAAGLTPDWLVGEIDDLPPGVKLAALLDVTLAALDVGVDIAAIIKTLEETGSYTEEQAIGGPLQPFKLAIAVVVSTLKMVTGL